MNKKILILVVPFLFLAIGGFILWQQFSKGGSTASVSSMLSSTGLTSSGTVQVTVGELPAGSIIPSLSEQVMAVASIDPRNFDPLGDHLANIRDRFAKTALWKKAGLDQLVEMYLNQSVDQLGGPALGALGSASPEAAMGAGALAANVTLTPNEIINILREEWSRLDEFVIALSADTFEVSPGMSSPRTMIALSFKDEDSRERVRKLVIEKLLGTEKSVTTNGVTIAKENSLGTKISLKAQPPGAGFSPDGTSLDAQSPAAAGSPPAGIEGAIEFEQTRMLISIGASEYRSFVSSAAGGSAQGAALKDTVRWSDLRMSILERPALFGFYDARQFLPYLEKSLKSFDPTGAAEMAGVAGAPNADAGSASSEARPALSPPGMKDLETIGISFNAINGIGARSCVTIARGSELAKVYQDAFENRAAGVDPALLKMVDSKTLAAFNISGEFIKLYTAASRVLRTGASTQAGAAKPNQDPEWQKFQKTYEALGRLLSKRSVREIGVLVNAPRPEQMALAMSPQGGAPSPDLGVVFEFDSAVQLADIAQMLNDAAVLLAGDSGMVQLPVAVVEPGTPGPDGQIPFKEVIRVSLGGYELVGSVFTDKILVLGKDFLALQGLRKQLEGGTALVSEASLAARGLGGKAGVSDFYMVLSTEPLLELARSFIPMALMMAPPDMQISMPDVDELLKILTFRLFAVQNGFKAAEGLYCSEGHGVAL